VKRDAALTLDAVDPLSPWREEFETGDGLLYLDGNSLGRLPRRTVDAMARTVEDEWRGWPRSHVAYRVGRSAVGGR